MHNISDHKRLAYNGRDFNLHQSARIAQNVYSPRIRIAYYHSVGVYRIHSACRFVYQWQHDWIYALTSKEMHGSKIAVELEHLDQIRTYAQSLYPEECCGLLLGKISSRGKTLTEVVPTPNSWSEQAAEFGELDSAAKPKSKQNRFSIAPQVMLQVQKQARDRNLNIIGIFHSHPDTAAVPSAFDRAIAWQQYSYFIASVQQGKATEILSWTLDESRQFHSEEILIIDSKDSKN